MLFDEQELGEPVELCLVVQWTGTGYKLTSKHPQSVRGAKEYIERLQSEKPGVEYKIAKLSWGLGL